MVAEIAESLSGMSVCEPELEKDSATPCFNMKKLKESLGTTKIYYETTFPEKESFIRDSKNVLDATRNEEIWSMRQSIISEYFKKAPKIVIFNNILRDSFKILICN